MKKISKLAVLTASVVLILTALAACTGAQQDPIVIGEGDWDSNMLHDQIVKIIIEEGYGYETDIVLADTAVIISGFKSKDMDFAMEIWSDNIPTYPEDIANGDYVELSVNFDDNMQGLYVPTYLVEGDDALAPNLKTVEDLKEYADLFPNPEDSSVGMIYGGPEGWLATAFLHSKMESYGLDEMYEFRSIDSGATLAATLASAYEKGEPWVGYYWEPTWIMGIYDMTLLEDSEYSAEDYEMGIGAFPTVDVTVVATPEFVEEYPEVAEFLSNYTTSSQLVSDALGYMQENGVEADEAAEWFIKENSDLVKSWLPDDVYEKVTASLG